MATETQVEIHREEDAHLSIIRELEQMRETIARRAHELFHRNGGRDGRELDDWLEAEREMSWKPSIELSEKDGQFTIYAAVPGVDAKDLDIQVSPEALLIKAEMKHRHTEEKAVIVHTCEFASGQPFPAR